jgi:hypothetical protein
MYLSVHLLDDHPFLAGNELSRFSYKYYLVPLTARPVCHLVKMVRLSGLGKPQRNKNDHAILRA